jgi:3-hydroxyisobutyrate dehydrogenase
MANGNTVALLGTGIMGAAMARNLVSAGIGVRAWNRTREKAEPLAEEGVEVADSPAEAVGGADFLLTMLPDADTTVEAAGDGALRTLSEGAVWLQMGTVGIEGNDRLVALAREAGVAYVDAPVLGTKEPAEQGKLVVLASGPEAVGERCEPVFDAVGGKTLWLGEAGEGSRLKLVTNNWIAGILTVLGETITFAEALGVDPERFLEVIEGGPLNAPYAQIKGRMMIEAEFPPSFSLKLARKDVGLILEAARSEGLRLALTDAVAERYDQAMQSGHGEEDMAAIYEAVSTDHGKESG